MNALFSFDLFMVYVAECKQQLRNNTGRYDILHTFNLAVVLLLSESRAIINDLEVKLHGFMLQIIYTTVFRFKRLNNITFRVRLFNRLTRENRGIIITNKIQRRNLAYL